MCLYTLLHLQLYNKVFVSRILESGCKANFTFESDGGSCRDRSSASLTSSVLKVKFVATELRIGDTGDGPIRVVVGRFTDILPVL
jgi:hypothetical protein